MRYYKVKPEYDQTYKNPRIHDGNILIGGDWEACCHEWEGVKRVFGEDEILEELREIN